MASELTRDEQTALRCLSALKQIQHPLSAEQEALYAVLQGRSGNWSTGLREGPLPPRER